MTTKSGIRQKPEEEELQQKRQELGDLERQLIERELQLVGLRHELAEFESLYVQKVGAGYANSTRLKLGSPSCWRTVPLAMSKRRVRRETRAAGKESQTNVAGSITKSARSSPSSSLKSLYREVAKRIHPDLAVDQNDRALRQRLMAKQIERTRSATKRGSEQYWRSTKAVLTLFSGTEPGLSLFGSFADRAGQEASYGDRRGDQGRCRIRAIRTQIESR